MQSQIINLWVRARSRGRPYVTIWQILHLDGPLLSCAFLLALVGLFILYSAGNQDWEMVTRQISRLLLAFSLMVICAQIPPQRYCFWAPYFFGISVFLLLAVLAIGHVGKGAERWLSLGFIRIQPSELVKLSLPMMLSAYLHDKVLPPPKKILMLSLLMILVPVALVLKQPDLGTAILVGASGMMVILLAGLSLMWLLGFAGLASLIAPIGWHFMHAYQRNRVLTFLNPERDPLGSGYHIIQSKIAIGSGGLLGKGWLHGSQSHLQFLPEHATDFIFAVCGEEFGFIGLVILLILYLSILGRGLYLSTQAGDTFSRLLCGSLALTFFISFFINSGMVTGILPVVGLPLPLISYGGTSMVTLMASLGIIMSIATHRKLIAT